MSDNSTDLDLRAKLLSFRAGEKASVCHCQWQIENMMLAGDTLQPLLYMTLDGGVSWHPLSENKPLMLAGEPTDMVAFDIDAVTLKLPKDAFVGFTLYIDTKPLNEYRRMNIDSSDAIFLRYKDDTLMPLGGWETFGPQVRIINAYREKKYAASYLDVLCYDGAIESVDDIRLYRRDFNYVPETYPGPIQYEEITDFDVLRYAEDSEARKNRCMIKLPYRMNAGEVYVVQHVGSGDTTRPIASKFTFPDDLSAGVLESITETEQNYFMDPMSASRYITKQRSYETTLSYSFLYPHRPSRHVFTLNADRDETKTWSLNEFDINPDVVASAIKSYYAYRLYSKPGDLRTHRALSKAFARKRHGSVSFDTPGSDDNFGFGCATKGGKGLAKNLDMFSWDLARRPLERKDLHVKVVEHREDIIDDDTDDTDG